MDTIWWCWDRKIATTTPKQLSGKTPEGRAQSSSSADESLHFLLYRILIEHGYTTPKIMEMGSDLRSAASLIDY
jgi:hypothetical protein